MANKRLGAVFVSGLLLGAAAITQAVKKRQSTPTGKADGLPDAEPSHHDLIARTRSQRLAPENTPGSAFRRNPRELAGAPASGVLARAAQPSAPEQMAGSIDAASSARPDEPNPLTMPRQPSQAQQPNPPYRPRLADQPHQPRDSQDPKTFQQSGKPHQPHEPIEPIERPKRDELPEPNSEAPKWRSSLNPRTLMLYASGFAVLAAAVAFAAWMTLESTDGSSARSRTRIASNEMPASLSPQQAGACQSAPVTQPASVKDGRLPILPDASGLLAADILSCWAGRHLRRGAPVMPRLPS